MKPHWVRIKSSASCVSAPMKWASNSKDPINGDIVNGDPASGAGAPYVPHRAFRAVVMAALWSDESVRFAFTAQEFPSWGERVVVSLSVKRFVVGFQRRLFTASFIATALGAHDMVDVVSLRTAASFKPSFMV